MTEHQHNTKEYNMNVNAYISDIFFNSDAPQTSVALASDGNQTYGLCHTKMEESAAATIGRLEGLGVQDLPTPKELVKDFFDRV